MNKDEYKKLVDRFTPKENKSKNGIIAFLVGVLAELIAVIIMNMFGVSSPSIEENIRYLKEI